MLLDHFGDEYREYMSRTGRLLPRLSTQFPRAPSLPGDTSAT